MRRSILALPLIFISLGCGEFREKADRKFGDQGFKTAIALIELHKARFGDYPETLNELKFTGDWDALALSSVSYRKLDEGYELNVVKGWVGRPELTYPVEFWRGLGLVKTNVKRGGGT